MYFLLAFLLSYLACNSHQISEQIVPLSPHLVPQQGGAVLHEHYPQSVVSQSAATEERFVLRSDENCRLAQVDLQPELATGYEAKAEATGHTMMVASANPTASKVGFEVLKRGGNAIDAVVAMQMVLGLVEPQSSGIGGGGLLLYYSKKDGQIIAYDGRETAPLETSMGSIPNIVGKESVGTPGVLKMLEMAHREQGMLSWKELFEPAIQLATNGFPISKRLHKLIKKTPNLGTFSKTRAYLFKNGKAKSAGSRLQNLTLAQTLRTIADNGTAPFYSGEIAQEIVNATTLSQADLAGYEAIKRKPVAANYHGYTLYGFPPPSSGGIAIAQIFGMLSDHDFKGFSPEFIDFFCKASRAAYADRQHYVGDPEFTNVPVDHLLNPIYLSHRLDAPTKTPISAYEHPSTSQICVVDNEGNAISFTTSIEHAFGSTLMVGGFFLNNQLTDFSSGPNRMQPGKRPMSSMAPTFVFKGDQLILNVGSAGGARIIDYVAKTLFGVLDFGLNIQEAISFPNFASIKETLDIEEHTFLEKDVFALKALGNTVHIKPLTSGTQGIQRTPEGLRGGVDPRREGLAIGN